MTGNHNYQRELEKVLENVSLGTKVPRLLLHSCCAPCSSYCLLYLREYFDITSFFYNPNITNQNEYEHRLSELIRMVGIMNEGCDNHPASSNPIKVLDGGFEKDKFIEAVKGLEDVPEGGARCAKCFALRLDATAKKAAEEGFDYFTTTLTISPLKDANLINSIGMAAGLKYGVEWLPTDFKKKGGYQESIKLSSEFGLYRQNYCGCEYSMRRDYNPKNNKEDK